MRQPVRRLNILLGAAVIRLLVLNAHSYASPLGLVVMPGTKQNSLISLQQKKLLDHAGLKSRKTS